MNNYDVLIIGAGVVGAAIARELTKYKLSVGVIEKEEDVSSGTTKANSGIVHAGYDAEPGTRKARMNVRGAQLIRELSKTLEFDYRQNGSMVLCFREEGLPALRRLYEKGVENGVEELRIVSGDEARELEPALSEKVVAALVAPTAGIVCPFSMNIAFAENAADNGAEFHFLTEAESVEKTAEGYLVKTNNGDYNAKIVVNAAGLYADEIHNMVSERKLHITPRRGEYVLMDREVGGLVNHTIFQLPDERGKGVLVTPTAHGNLLVGPNAEAVGDKEELETTAAGMADIRSRALESVPNVPYNKIITSFAGLRATEDGHEFVIGECDDAPGFFDAAGIESPGLTSSPAIGEYLAEEIAKKLGAEKKENFISTRKGFTKIAKLPPEERAAMIKERPEYGKIVCRCENISEGEILDAIHRTLGAKSMDGIKRRVRQGMGRCQAGFCTPETIDILARELGISPYEVTKNRPGSELLSKEAE